MTIRGKNNQFFAADAILDSLSRPLETEKRLRRFVETARTRAFLKSRYSWELSYPLTIRLEARANFATFGSAILTPNSKARWTDQKMCQMIARVIALRRERKSKWYDRTYCEVYLDVVRAMMGKAAHDLLKERFKSYGVKFRPKRKVTMTIAQRDAAGARLKAAREAKANA